MTSQGRPTSGERKNTSSDARQLEEGPVTKESELESLRKKYREADSKLLRREEELDILLHWAHLLRERRTKLLTDTNERKPEDSDENIDAYLSLAKKSKAIDKEIRALKGECASARSECSYLARKFPRSSLASEGSQHRRPQLHNEKTLPQGGPESGFIDREAVAERILVAEDTALNVGGVVGAFGAGLTYTTLFSATRGRLDLIAWAFTCFIMVIVDSTALQMFTPPRHSQMANIFRLEYSGSAEQKLLVFVVLVGAPMVSGLALLAMSVALLDAASDQPNPGSQIAIQAAGYLPTAALGYFVIAMIVAGLGAVLVRFVPWSTEHMPEEARKFYRSLLFAVKDKLYFLPGGEGYPQYRSKHKQREGDT